MRIIRCPSFSMQIHASFFVFALVCGILLEANIRSAAIVMGVIFCVFTVHELGAALMGRLFRRPCSVVIWATGGQTEVVGPQLRLWQRSLVTLSGLLATYLSLQAARLYAPNIEAIHPFLGESLFLFFVLSGNWFWLNAIPLYPFDGGKIIVDLAGTCFGRVGEKAAACLSILVALIVTLYVLSVGTFLGLFFTLYAIGQSYNLFKHPAYCRGTSGVTEDEMALHDLQERWLKGEQEEVIVRLHALATSSKEREVRQQAVEWCAEYLLLLERPREAYDLLVKAKDPLMPLALEHLSLAAYRTSHFLEGLEACRAAFTARQTLSVAVLAAMLSGRCDLEEEAIEWLIAAKELGLQNMVGVVEAADFDPIRASAAFQEYMSEQK